MIYYVSHKFDNDMENYQRAKEITHDLQIKDLENTYICPILALSHLGYNEIGYDEETQICLDVLSVSDKLIVASDISRSIQAELDFAKLIGMEVEYLDAK